MSKRLVAVSTTSLLLVGLGSVPAYAVDDSSAGISHSLVVYHSNKGANRLFGICDHWTSTEESKYKCDGNWGSLYKKENSLDKYGWEDTDAVQVTKNYKLKVDRAGPDSTYAAACDRGTYYVKVSPAVFNHKVKFYLKKC